MQELWWGKLRTVVDEVRLFRRIEVEDDENGEDEPF
jgi:hypothetical protein